MRRHPLRGPIAALFYSGIALSVGAGAGVTALLCLLSGSPLATLTGPALPPLLSAAWLLSAYLPLFVAGWILVGSGLWRGVVMLAASVIVSGVGLVLMVWHWFIAPRPVSALALYAVPLIQWVLVVLAIAAAVVPGILIGLALDRAASAARQQAEGRPAD
jgi:hypothetical protein